MFKIIFFIFIVTTILIIYKLINTLNIDENYSYINDSNKNINKSPYYSNLDIFNLKSNDTLTIISNFKTYQQTTEYTCAPATALMILNYYGLNDYDEMQLTTLINSTSGYNCKESNINLYCEQGTSTLNLVNFFKSINWSVDSSLSNADINGYSFHNIFEFKKWVIKNLKESKPIMVEWIDWGGHWQCIIGYDTMGTENINDDIIIFADPYDTTDHNKDGYYIFSVCRFFQMWIDKDKLPYNQRIQQWVIAYPRK